jgi:hypothetical protein
VLSIILRQTACKVTQIEVAKKLTTFLRSFSPDFDLHQNT